MSSFTVRSAALAALLAASVHAAPTATVASTKGPVGGAHATTQVAVADATPSSDFAGVGWNAPSAQTLTEIVATMALPTISAPAGANTSANYYYSLWTGIYGAGEGGGLLQSGCDLNTQPDSDGHVSSCWVEWLCSGPNCPAIYIGMYPSYGDDVIVDIKALSPTEGFVQLVDVQQSSTFTTTMTPADATATILQGGNGVGITMETTPTPTLPAYSPDAVFNGITVYDQAGSAVPIPTTAHTGEVVDPNGNTDTDTTYTGNSVDIKYVG